MTQFSKRKKPTLSEYINGIQSGNRILLSRAITLIESTSPKHVKLAQEIISECLKLKSKSRRIGITGAPGVGKSTFIEQLGTQLIEKGHQVAVLAVDPSSQVSKGSILGDKTRMDTLSTNPKAYIRPSPAGTSLGGVARKTRETIILCEAAGYDTILIETVGVGQSETIVHSMVDFFILLLLPGAGDELQGIKRGIVEMADFAIVNKADGDRDPLVKQTVASYRNALHLFQAKSSNWVTKVNACSALENRGIDKVINEIENYFKLINENDFINVNRQNQAKFWFKETLQSLFETQIFENMDIQKRYNLLEQKVLDGKISPFLGAQEVIDFVFKK